LLIGQAKVAGILIEGESEPVFAVAIGIGVNCATHPNDTSYPATNLAATGTLVGPDALFAALSVRMAQRLAQWNRGQGFAAIRGDWLKRAAGLGEKLQVRLRERELSGRFEGLDEAGRLLLKQGDDLSTVTAGEVFGFGER